MTVRLEKLCRDGLLSEYEKCTIVDMSKRVLEQIASGYEKIREGVRTVMGGQILEYEAKTILNEGLEQGREQGIHSFAVLTAKLLEKQRLEDLKRATEDISYRKKLYEELNIRIGK